MSGEEWGYTWFESTDLDVLIGVSRAVVTATVVEVEGPTGITPTGIDVDELPDRLVDQLADELTFRAHIRIDEVLAGTLVEQGGEYTFPISARRDGDEILEFSEDPIPAVGDSFLMFLNGEPDPAPPGTDLRNVGVGTGRMPLDRSDIDAVLAEVATLTGRLGADIEPA